MRPQKTPARPEIEQKAREGLLELKERFFSWRGVAEHLKEKSGLIFDRGFLRRVANRDRGAPNKLLVALGLPPIRQALADVCPRCGVVHLRKCRARNMPEGVSRAAFEAWLDGIQLD